MAKIIIDKSKEYGFKLEVSQVVELDNSNEPEYYYNILFIDTETGQKVETIQKVAYSLYFIKDNKYIFVIYRHVRDIYNAIYKKLEKVNPQVAKSMKKANQDIYLSISQSDYEMLNNAYHSDIEKLKQNLLAEFNQKGILLEFYPDRIDADGDIIYLSDSYKLSSESENLLTLLFNIDSDKIVEKVFNYCQKHNLFNTVKKQSKYDGNIVLVKSVLLTQELLEKALKYVTENERKQLEKRLSYLESLLSDKNKLLEYIFTNQVHITDEGFFSECDEFCDDCIYIRYIEKPYYNDVKEHTESFTVKSKNGKSYTYYSPNEKVLKILETKYQNEVTKTIEKITNEIKKIKEVLKWKVLYISHFITETLQ